MLIITNKYETNNHFFFYIPAWAPTYLLIKAESISLNVPEIDFSLGPLRHVLCLFPAALPERYICFTASRKKAGADNDNLMAETRAGK